MGEEGLSCGRGGAELREGRGVARRSSYSARESASRTTASMQSGTASCPPGQGEGEGEQEGEGEGEGEQEGEGQPATALSPP